jgi:predicted nucleotidyltransferase
MKHLPPVQPEGVRFEAYAHKDELITTLRKWAEAHPEVIKVIVYGSRARGEHRPDSDFDVAIEMVQTPDEDGCAVWMYEQDNWRNELGPLLPWRLHLEWHDLNGNTMIVSGKIEKGHLIVFAREL